MATPLLAGRDFTPADAAGRPNVAIVNEAFAAKYYFGQNPVGRTFVIERFGADRKPRQLEIVGLVANAKYQNLREQPQPTMYAAMAQQDQISSSVRMAIKMIASLSSFFGSLALMLAALGLYGVMSYSVTRRKNEIGIRMALGAEPDKVVRLVLKHVAFITVIGLVVGAAGAVATGRFINALLFNPASDKTMIALTAVTLAAAAAVAGYLPARRAARIDPMTALRED